MWFVPPDPLDSEKVYDVGIQSIPYIAGDEMLWLRSKKTAGESYYSVDCIPFVFADHTNHVYQSEHHPPNYLENQLNV